MGNNTTLTDEEIQEIIDENEEAMRLFYEMYNKIKNGDR